MEIKLGKYKHFKGPEYEVMGLARHSETLEEFVVYKDSKDDLWVRPSKMFFEEIKRNGKKMPRFKYIGK
ncbi:MAG: DUF1653 domain-containing protein [Candidatus Staskawiczbacteria bacterium]|nr:DUF1653 domain-containing protein [Candidatus Staskawiczbacteria bacterium]